MAKIVSFAFFFNRSYQWIMKHNGIPTEDSYGNYLGIDGFCHVDDPTTVMALQVNIFGIYIHIYILYIYNKFRNVAT